jgi:hypothetical protein
MVARELTEGGKVLVPTEDGKQIGAEILKHGIQVFVADPFVTIHRVNENDNVQIDGVLTILRDLAHSTNSAVEVAHHFRKLNGDEANVDAIRGASSLSGACRSVRIVSAMNKEMPPSTASMMNSAGSTRGYRTPRRTTCLRHIAGTGCSWRVSISTTPSRRMSPTRSV